MDKELFDYVAERVEILKTADTSTQVTRDAATAWQEAVAADSSEAAVEEATNKFLGIMQDRPTTIDGVIGFLSGPAKEMLGEEAAAAGLAVQEQRKAEGAKWCDCPSCKAATEILAKFGRVEL